PLATRARPARPDQATPAPIAVPAPAVKHALPALAIEEVLVEDGKATFVDEGAAPVVRVELPRVKLTARNVTWPATAPVNRALEGARAAGAGPRGAGAPPPGAAGRGRQRRRQGLRPEPAPAVSRLPRARGGTHHHEPLRGRPAHAGPARQGEGRGGAPRARH